MNGYDLSRTLNRILFVGGSSKVGRLIKKSWSKCSSADIDLHFQFRRLGELRDSCDVHLDPWANGISVAPCSELHYDTIVIFAGATSGPQLIDLNAEIARKWLDFSVSVGCDKVILASSSAVYGAGRNVPFKETDIPRPSNEYGSSKLKMERSLAQYRKLGLNICSLRIGNVLGADSLWRSIRSASKDRAVKLDRYPNGRGPLRSYIEPSTLLKVLERLSLLNGSELPQVLNVANPHATQMEDILNSVGVPWQWSPSSFESLQKIVLDCSSLEEIFDFSSVELDATSMVNRLYQLERSV